MGNLTGKDMMELKIGFYVPNGRFDGTLLEPCYGKSIGDDKERRAAMAAKLREELGDLANQPDRLIKLLEEEEPWTWGEFCCFLVETLGKMKAKEAIPVFISMLDMSDISWGERVHTLFVGIRAKIIQALGRIEDKKTIPIMERELIYSLGPYGNRMVGEAAIQSLVEMGGDEAVESLKAALKVVRERAHNITGARAITNAINQAINQIKATTKTAKPETQKAGAGDAFGAKGTETVGLGGPAACKFLKGRGGTGIPGLGGIAMLGKHKTFKPFKLKY